jgi:WD40 repeat protein
VTSVAISPDGQLLASGSEDKTIKLWSLPGGVLVNTLPGDITVGDSGGVYSVAFSPDGRCLASGSYDETIKLWSLPDGTLLKTLTGHGLNVTTASAVDALAFTPDSGLLISGAWDYTMKLWSLPEGKLLPVCLMDPAGSLYDTRAVAYTIQGRSYTVPFGTPMPAGSTCTCNAVYGSLCSHGCSWVCFF